MYIINPLRLSFRYCDTEESRIANLSASVNTRASFHQFRSYPRRPKVIFPEDPGQCFHRVPMKRRTREAGGGHTSPLRVFPRWNENVGSLTLAESRENWTAGGRTDGRGGGVGGRGPRVVIYEVSKTLYTPTRQRAGLAPRNPVLALTHRYLSHYHFRPIRARGGTPHTYVASTGLLYPLRRCLYHLQCPSCRQRGRVPCRYGLSGVQSTA